MKCTKLEIKLIDYIKKYYRVLFFIIVSMMGVLVRFCGRYFISTDMSSFLLPWFEVIKSSGKWKALGIQVGDYNLLYQTIIALGTYITDNALFYYKIISTIGDFALSFSCAYTVAKICHKSFFKDDLFNILYACVLLLPTVVINSAFWGQCDSLYTTFIIWTIYFLFTRKYKRAFTLYGIAFAFKFQSIFLLPFIVFLYFSETTFSFFNIIYTVVVFWLSGVAAFLNGRDLLAPFKIYTMQAGEYNYLFIGIESFWKLVCDTKSYDSMVNYTILFTFAVLGLALYCIISQKMVLYSYKEYIQCACWSIWTVILFLPAMHERYTYMLDILLLVLVFLETRYLFFAFSEIIISLNTYGKSLFNIWEYDVFFTIFEVGLWFAFSCVCYCTLIKKVEDIDVNK